VTTANTATISRIHAIVFSVQANDTDPTIVDGFKIGSSLEMGDVTAAPMYEHIWKFMEEKGPHLPDGENTAKKINSPTLLECLANTRPYGQTLKHWWANARVLTIFAFLFAPITFPILTLLGIFSWSSYATSVPIRWSEQVVEAIGEPIEEECINSSGLMGK
jgi:hypothetical protein